MLELSMIEEFRAAHEPVEVCSSRNVSSIEATNFTGNQLNFNRVKRRFQGRI